MDHEDKRPRLSTGWPAAGPSHHGHGVSLPHPGPPLTTPTHHTQPLPPPTSSQYSPSPHLAHPPPTPSQYSTSPHSAHPSQPFPRPQDFPPPHQQPHQQQQPPQQPQPPPPPQQQQQQPPPPPPPHNFDDRRQHEQERFSLPQDHRHHPPPSPAHQHYPPSAYQPPGRDSMVKRESDDIKLPQIVRPNSTGNGPEQSPLPAPPPHGHPPPVHMEERRHMSYDNGSTPQMYRHPTYPPPPPTPLSHPGPPPTPYEQNQMYAPPMGPDGPYPITYAAAGGKRKSQRASQACDSCRQLKAKCDENKPCKNCLDKNMTCNYRDPAPKQQDKATQDILDAVQKMLQTDRREILAEIVGLKSELRELRSDRKLDSSHSSLQGGPGDFMKKLPRAGSPAQLADADESVSSISPADAPTNGIPDPEAAARRMRLLENEEETEEPPGETIRPQEAPFPHDHTTPAGRLLRWPSIRDLVRPLLMAEGVEWIDSYPQRWEESRGQLPLFGRGEASVTRPVERDAMYDYVDIADDNSQVGDHQSPSGVTDWGPIGGMASPGGGVMPADMRSNVSRADGALDFDEKRVWHYVAVYKNHIQNMHPLIPPADLDAMVVSFLEEVGARKSTARAKFASQQEGPMQSTLEYDRKRKRSPGPNGAEPGPPAKKLKPQRSVKHALVLVVLALGKICNWRDRKLPEAVEKEPAANHNSPVVRNGHVTSPTHGSPPSSAVSQSPGQVGLPSPKDIDRGASRRSSMQASNMQAPTSAASPAPTKKNYEVIPGLEYFAYATDILGNQFGGYKLSHVQAHILVSLYYAQLGRVIPSFRHIRFACQAIVDKLQPAMARLNRLYESQQPVSDPRDNKYLIAFWTCCQLESDILAELNLQPSGILQYESLMPVPEMVVLCNELKLSEPVVNSYLAQLWLRKRLNEISGQLYNPNYRLELPHRLNITNSIERGILDKKDVAGGKYAFDVNDPPAEDILHARFRAKFWGANVLTYRPYIENIMAWSHAKRHPEEYRDKAYSSASVPSDATTPSDIPQIVTHYARKGIDVLFKSTEAFHGLPDKRFIITNIFGTAHAQWGNLVTLAAAYQDPALGQFIDEGKLRRLFRKTIEFFEVVAQDSSSLAVDLKVLRGLLDALPPKDRMVLGSGAFPQSLPPPLPNDQSFFPNGPVPHNIVPGPSPQHNTNSNTPSDMGQGTPMEMS